MPVAIDDAAVDPASLAETTSSVSIVAGDTGEHAFDALTTGSTARGATGSFARATGPIPRSTGSLPRTTGSMPAPRRTGSAYDALLG